jgi:uncharacterized membrane protein YvbJ
MAICKNCGVDLGEGNEKCPLCEPSESRSGKIVTAADLFRLSRIENTRHLYEITMLWSVITAASLVIIAMFFIFIHYTDAEVPYLYLTGFSVLCR